MPCANNSCDWSNGTRLSASLSNVSFVEPSIDLLQAYYRRIDNVYESNFLDEPPYYFNFAGDNWPNTLLTPERGTKVNILEYNSSMEIVFQVTNLLNSAEEHPMHVRGYSFYLVGYGFGNFDNETDPKVIIWLIRHWSTLLESSSMDGCYPVQSWQFRYLY